MTDYYQILGVGKDAKSDAIKKAYLKLARERHPDRFTDPDERAEADRFFKDLTAAFNTLSNPASRRDYDESLTQPKRTGPDEIAADAYARGLQQYEQQNFHDAVDLLRAAVHHMPKQAEYRAALGKALAKNPKWAREAISELDQAIQLAPRKAEYHVVLASLYLGQGLKLRARRAAEAGLKHAPGDARLLKIAEQAG